MDMLILKIHCQNQFCFKRMNEKRKNECCLQLQTKAPGQCNALPMALVTHELGGKKANQGYASVAVRSRLPVSLIERAAHTLHVSCSSHLAIINTCSEYLSKHLHLAHLVIVQCPQRTEI